MGRDMQKSAFTLIEVLFATILVGLAVASLMAANITFTKANGMGADMSTAEFMVEQIRELTAPLPAVDPTTGIATFGPEAGETLAGYDDVDDFNGGSYCPPINSNRTALTDFSNFTQQIMVENVSAIDLQTVVAHHGSAFYRVTVKILLNSREICSESWIRARY